MKFSNISMSGIGSAFNAIQASSAEITSENGHTAAWGIYRFFLLKYPKIARFLLLRCLLGVYTFKFLRNTLDWCVFRGISEKSASIYPHLSIF